MSIGPLKVRGFQQDLNTISATAKEKVGTLRITQDGRFFRYAKAGSSALVAGKCGQAAAIVAAHQNEAGAISPVAVGSTVLTLTVTAGTAIAENELKGGYLQINDSNGEGYQYPIASNTALTAAGTSIIVSLEEGLRSALVSTTSEFTLVHSPWYGVTEAAVSAFASSKTPVGIPVTAVTANYYYWCQTGGVAICLTAGTIYDGRNLALAATAGALKSMPVASAELATAAQCILYAGTSTEYNPVMLKIY